MTHYLLNGWSFKMARPMSGFLAWHTIPIEEARLQAYDAISCVGNEDLARVLTNLFGYKIEYNRENIKLNKGDVVIVCYVDGGKIPEGATRLPEYLDVDFKCVKILEGI